MKRILPYLSLLFSLGTLICCALPALLVAIGLGASLAAAVSAVPQLVWFSENKGLVFGIAGGLILFSLAVQLGASRLSCPADPALAEACGRGRRFSRFAVVFSLVIYLIGAFFAFLAPLIFGG